MSTIEDDVKGLRPRAGKVSRYGLYRDTWPLLFVFNWYDANDVIHTWCAECEKVVEGLPDGELGIRWKIMTEPNPNYDPELPDDIYTNPQRIPLEVMKPPIQGPDLGIYGHRLYYVGTPPKLIYIASLALFSTGQPEPSPVYEYVNKNWILRGYMDGGTVNQFIYGYEHNETAMSYNKILPNGGTDGFGPPDGPYDSPMPQLTAWFPTFRLNYVNGIPHGTEPIALSSTYAGNNTIISCFKTSGLGIGLWAGRIDGFGTTKVTGHVYFGSPPYWDWETQQVVIPEDCYIFERFTYPKIGGGALVADPVPTPYDPTSSTSKYIDGHNWGGLTDGNYYPPAHLLWTKYGFSRLRSMLLEGLNALGWVNTSRSGWRSPYVSDRAWAGCYGVVLFGTIPVLTSDVSGGKAAQGPWPSTDSINQVVGFYDEAWMTTDWAGFTRNWYMEEFGDNGSQAKWIVTPKLYGGKTSGGVTRVVGYASTTKTEYYPGGTPGYFGGVNFPQKRTVITVTPVVNTDPGNPLSTWDYADPSEFPGMIPPTSGGYSTSEIAGVDPSTDKITFVDRDAHLIGFAVPGGYFSQYEFNNLSGSATLTSYIPLDKRTIVVSTLAHFPHKVTAMTLEWPGLIGDPPVWEFDIDGCRIENFCDIRLAETNELPTVVGYGLPRVTFTYTYMADQTDLIDYTRVWPPTQEDLSRGGMYAEDTSVIGLTPYRLPWPWVNASFGTSSEYVVLSTGEGRDPDYGTLAPAPTTQSLEFAYPTPHRLQPAERGMPYTAAIIVTGGRGPFTYSVTSGSLPLELALDNSTGIISGNTSAGAAVKDYTVTIEVHDMTLPVGQVISGQFVIAVY